MLKNPVLAKRKTTNMKLMEQSQAEAREVKRARASRHDAYRKNNVKPDVMGLDKERKLKKTATKGVVALFNAINTFQKEQRKQERKLRAAKEEGASRDTKAQLAAAPKSTALSVLRAAEEDEEEDDVLGGGGGGSSSSSSRAAAAADTAPQWDVLKDDYMMDAKMKDWDRAEEDIDLEERKRRKTARQSGHAGGGGAAAAVGDDTVDTAALEALDAAGDDGEA